MTWLECGNLPLIGSGPVVAGRTGNNGHFVGTLVEVLGMGASVVLSNASTKTRCGTKKATHNSVCIHTLVG